MHLKDTLLTVNRNGIYCAAGDFYIDPWRGVDRAVVTHGHSDHARPGSRLYLSCKKSELILKERLGNRISLQTADYNSPVVINGVTVSFHPAGHIPGSAQVRVEYRGEIWVVSGDYKLEDDGLSDPFEPVKCHAFITESTFGAPVYHWAPQEKVYEEVNGWWSRNCLQGKTSVIYAYSLGKSQRLINGLDHFIGRIYCHPAVASMNERVRQSGFTLKECTPLSLKEEQDYRGALVIIPQSSGISEYMRRFTDPDDAYISGWMQIKKIRKSSGRPAAFTLSDHADWPGLLKAIEATGAHRIYATHGYTELLTRWLLDSGYDASVLPSPYTGRE
ncbi:MAG: ligase-associated DNA damage response exonuclease [Ignavibacteriaceae bacterium]|nr:ligase-associated DNA damage response exonuclease [Ignavibacteriaceae bacterium]